MIYVVSGWQGTGTSMMMEALIAGGMKAVWDPEKDKRLNAHCCEMTGKLHNERYYEFEEPCYHEPGFFEQHDGKMLKVLFGGLIRLPQHMKYRIIYMRRPQEEVIKSIRRTLGPQVLGNAVSPAFDDLQDYMVAKIKRFPDMFESCDEIWYGDVLDDPLAVFSMLAHNGWPIDAKKAASIPDQRKQRHTSGEPLAAAI